MPNLSIHRKAVNDGIAYAKRTYRPVTVHTLSVGITYALSGNLYCEKDEECDRRLIKLPTHAVADETYRFQRQKDCIRKTLIREYDTERKLVNAVVRDLWDANLLSKTRLSSVESDGRVEPDNPVAYVRENGRDYSTELNGVKV